MSAAGADTSGRRQPVAFISHHSSQVETARQLKKVLGLNGVDGWMAPDDIDPGRPFDQAIIEQVRRSDLIILLFCSRSDQSRHVKRELMMAENGDKLIFPVRLENIDAEGLAYWLNDYQWIDWFDRRDDTIQRMIDTIKRIVEVSTANQKPSEPAPPVVAPPPEESVETASPEPEPPVDEGADEPDPVPPIVVSPPAPPPPPPAEPPAPATAKSPDPADSPDEPGPLKVAPVAAGRAAAEDGNDGAGPPDRKKIIVIGAALLAAVIIAALFFLLSGGDSEDAAEAGVLSPSVDCSNAELTSHGIICASEDLSARETALSNLYEAVLAQAEGEQRISLQQGYAAFQARRDECRTAACIATVYDAREGELGQYDVPVETDVETVAAEDPAEELTPETQATETPVETAPTERTPAAERPGAPVETRPTPVETRPTPQPDPPRTGRATPPEPIGNPGNWVRASDYPSNILRNGEEGTSRYQVRVGANGVPTACFTIGSSGHFQLDARACNMVMSRARFRPGRDASGNPAAGLYSGSHRWRAPR
jgi:uncharacterized protein